jgi:hypothetical protein
MYEYIKPRLAYTQLDVLVPTYEKEEYNTEGMSYLLLFVVSHYTSATKYGRLSSPVIQ